LAFVVDVVAALDVPFDVRWDHLGGRHGYVALDTFTSSTKVDETVKQTVLASLPATGRPAIAAAPRGMLRDIPPPDDMSRAPRVPARAVKEQVLARSGGLCELMDCQDVASHFDHIWPWNRGGNSELANIQHLCARHNLEKADRLPATDPLPEQLWIQFMAEGDLSHPLVISDQLDGLIVRTANSRYFVVHDQGCDATYRWKARSRTVYVTHRPFEPLVRRPPGKDYLALCTGPEEDPDFRSSEVLEATAADGAELLELVNLAPGDPI
jgi:5-methylcytosine-specific restriction endonuclease McrA